MSGTGTPYIGSKISLISKAKIRYEGYLYTIDSKDSTVTLAKVVSLGTEDRVPDAPIPARDEVFEYIVFRGTDIDDLHVSEGPKTHTDPAIVHTGHAHSSNGLGYPPISRGQVFPPNYPQFGAIPSPFGYSPFGYQNVLDSQGRLRRNSLRQVSPTTLQRSPTPEEMSRRDQRQSSGRIRYDSGKSQDDRNEQREEERNYRNQNQGRDDRERRDSDRRSNQTRDEWRDGSRREDSKREEKRDDTRRDSARRGDMKRDDSKRDESRRSDSRRDDSRREDSRREGDRKGDSQRQESRRESARNNQDSRQGQQEIESEERSRRGSGPSNRYNRNNQSRSFSRSNSGDKDKFKEDFDFESSNAKFNKDEIEKELLKVLKSSLKLKDDDEVIEEGDSKSNISEDEKDEDELESLPSPDKFYDRSKSFFDNISCEAMADKENEPTLTRRQERSLNVDTFGPVANSYRSGFYRRGRGRGRGQFRGQGRGRGYSRGRGGFRGGQNSRTWVDYDFDYEAAGIRNRNAPVAVR